VKINIIVVEDETRVRESIASFIMEFGHTYCLTGCASNGFEALKLFEQRQINVVLTDIEMPKMDGLRLVEQISEYWPDTKIVILSGYDKFEYVRMAMQHGVTDYLLKPIKREELNAVLVKVTSHLWKDSKKQLTLMANLEKWDMPLIRLESKLFDAVEKGQISAAKEGLEVLLKELSDRVAGDNLRLIPFIVDCLVSLRKRLSTIDTVPAYFDIEWKKLLDLLYPQVSFETIQEAVSNFIVFCTTKVIECRKQSCPNVLFICQQFLHGHYMKEVSLQELADIGGVTPAYLSRLFKKELGINYTDYLNQIRVEKAKELLEIPHIKVLEVASQVGFNNSHYFSRVFKRSTGRTPQDYRLERVCLP
jgi:two-component system response regulator YesN